MKKTIIIVVLAIIIGLGIGYFIFRSNPKEIIVEKTIEVEDTKKIDSLNFIIKTNEELIESLKDSVREKIVYVEKRVEEIKELPIDENLELFRDNLLVYGENFEILDTLPSLCQVSESEDTLVLMSEDNLIDVNTIVAKYEGTMAINDYYLSTIKSDSVIINSKSLIILEKDEALERQQEIFDNNMKELEKIIKKERRKQIYFSVGTAAVVGTIAYFIFKK